jgi:hypothetical protein
MKRRYHLFFCSSEKRIRFFLRRFSVFFFIVLLQAPLLLQAQSSTAPETEARLKKAAEKYFDQQDYTDAYPLYSQLLSLYPRDPNYNYRFGACMLFVSKADIGKAVHYIQYGIKQATVDNLAYYFYGMGLHLNYRFDDAINSYQKFEQGASAGDLKKYPVTQLIGMCNNGKALVSTQNGLDVLRKTELKFSNLAEAYNMHANGGSLILEPDDFKSKIDKEKKVSNLMYLTPDRSKVFFSSYGIDDKNGKDIYMAERNPNGTLGTPVNLGPVINTQYDEDYPIYDAPRNTLFFSSKGHNSMGGYDIFESLYNDSSQTWSEPVNVDFPINTPDDDILFVPDTTAEIAFFASTRSCPQGKIDVYKIAIHLRPPQSVIIAGTAYKVGGTTPTFCKITVKDSATNNIIGVYTSSSYDGKYSFSLPAGRKYNFTMEDSTHPAQSQSVAMPAETTVSTMQQDIQFDASGRLQINNHTAEAPKDTDTQFALNYIHDQAQMDVNVDTNSIQPLLAKNNPANLNSSSVIPSAKSTNGPQNTGAVSPVAITPSVASTANNGTVSPDSATTLQPEQQAQVLNEKGTKAIDYASDKMEEAEQLQVQANDILDKLDGSSGANIDTARLLSSESKVAYQKGMEAYQLAAEEKNEAATKQLQIDKAEGNTNSSSNDNNEISTTKVSPADLIKAQADQVKEDSVELASSNADLQQEVTGLQQKSQDFITQAGQTSDPQQKIALLQQADDLSKSREEKQEEMKENEVQLQQLHNEYTWLNGKAQKADNTPVATNASSANPALQQEIDSYAVNNSVDSSATGNVSNNAENEVASNTNSNVNSKHTHHRKKVSQPTQTANTVATSSQPENITNTNSGNQNPATNQTPVAVTYNTPPANNSTEVNQNTPTTNNTPPVTTTDNVANTDNGSNTDANNTTPVIVPNNSSPELTQTNTPTHSDTIVASSTPVNNTPSVATYNTPNLPTDVLLDSLANTNPAPQTSNNASSIGSNSSQISSVSTVQYNDVTASGLNQKSQSYFVAANAQAGNAQKLRSRAQAENSKAQAEVFYNQADSIDNLVFALNLKGDEVVADANNHQYSANANQISNSPVPSGKGQEDRVALAQSILKEAADSYSKSVTERDSAKNISSPTNKRSYVELEEKDLAFAILKQQQAVHLYFQADSAQSVPANNTPPVVAATNQNATDNIQPVVVPNPVSNAPTLTTTTPVITPTGNTPVVIPNTTAPVVVPTDNTPTVATNATAPVVTPTNNTSVATNTTAPKVTPTDNTPVVTNTNTPAANPTDNMPVITSNTNHHKRKKEIPVVSASDGVEGTTPVDNFPSASLSETANIFMEVRQAAYSTVKPIPIDQSLPKGLIFAVQVGAFRNSIPQNLFKGFEPIIGLTAPEGYVRYVAGVFRTLDPAKDAEGKIRNLGYPEAFIVAYYDGKRITIQEALSKLGISAQPVVTSENPQQTTQESTSDNIQGGAANPVPAPKVASLVNSEPDENAVASENNQSLVIIGNTITPSKKALIDTKRKDKKAIKDTVPPEANSINNVKGLVYTVQVGSFSTHKGFTRLRKIKQLYSWTSDDGTIKYNSGTYSNAADAGAAKNIIVANTAVKDAFVSAYYNGKRITTAQAKALLNTGVQPVSPAAINTNGSDVQTPNNTSNVSTNPVENTSSGNEEVDSNSFAFASQTRVIYTIRIASFTGQLPVRTVNKLLKYASDGIEPHKEAQGVTTYYGGKFSDYAPAEALQQKFIDGGFRKAIVVAYYHGKKISLDVAKSITNK